MSVFASLSVWAVVKTVFRVLLWLFTMMLAYRFPGFIIDAMRSEDEKEYALHAGVAGIDFAVLVFLLAMLIKY